MASSYKTDNYKLSKWISTDVPEMKDFNHDNELIDTALSTHESNAVKHITAAERDKWNNQMHTQIYVGNGASTQTVALTSSFNPRVCLVFLFNNFPSVTDFSNNAHYNYFGIASTTGNMLGLSISGKNLSVTHSTVPVFTTEYRSFNEKGSTYIVIAFR